MEYLELYERDGTLWAVTRPYDPDYPGATVTILLMLDAGLVVNEDVEGEAQS